MIQSLVYCLVVSSLIILSACQFKREKKAPPPRSMSAIEALSADADTDGFAKATQVRPFTFPRDHGPHPNFQTEWWYYTGNLSTAQGREFGYQLTFFRRALKPEPDSNPNDWTTSQVYFAHFTLSDIQNQAFYPFERWGRGSIGLAGAQAKPYKVWLENWQAEETADGVRLKAQADAIELELAITPVKPLVLNGNQGLSQKSSGEGNASYYYSQTRLKSEGQIRIHNQPYSVQGQSWLDREWSTSVLEENQTGWDWFSLQLDDGSELMLYQLRLKDGKLDSHSSGTRIFKAGHSEHVAFADFKIAVESNWISPKTGIRYPAKWHLSLPKYKLDLTVTPKMSNQELPLSFTYWEGAVQVSGSHSGQGYVEMTGYEKPD